MALRSGEDSGQEVSYFILGRMKHTDGLSSVQVSGQLIFTARNTRRTKDSQRDKPVRLSRFNISQKETLKPYR